MPSLQTAIININALGTHTVITGSSTTPTIQVVSIYFQCGVATNLTIRAGTTALTGPMSFSNAGLNLPNNGGVLFECDSGTDFVMDLAGLTGQVAGALTYYQF